MVSLRTGSSEREFLNLVRGLGMGFRVESTGHRYIYVLRHEDPGAIEAFLTSLRLGIIPMGDVTLARPFNERITLGESRVGGGIAYDVESVLREVVPRVLSPRPRGLRLRVRGHGIGVGNAVLEVAREVLNDLGVGVRRRSTLMLDIEVLRASSGGVRLYIGFFPTHLYVRCTLVRRITQSEDALVPRATPFTQYY